MTISTGVIQCTAALLLINIATFFLYQYDKHLAKQHAWRIPEYILLGSALIGGSPAAFYAMRRFRHKTSKTSFRIRYWMIVALQVGAALLMFSIDKNII